VGVQFIGNFWQEGKILQAAYAFESAAGWGSRVASLS
jgi:Asp-tRNA(Asn)/Glu-tRNA(Gln) amidotransferase A subunit family amidase